MMLLASLTLLFAPALQTQVHAPVQLRFDGPAEAGEILQARVSTTAVGAPAFLAVGPTGTFDLAGPGQPLFAVNPFGAGRFFKGMIGADGQFAPRLPLPATGLSAGQQLSWQAAVRDGEGRFHVSPRIDLVVGASKAATWVDGSAALPSAVMTEATTTPHAGDFDRDGDLDLIVLGESTVFYLRNDGGQFIDATAGRFPAEISYCTDCDAADFNGDGHLDLVFVGRRASSGNWENPVVVLNDGSGIFHLGAELPSYLENGSRVVVGDVDGDADTDVLLTIGGQHSGGGSSTQTLALFRNQGGTQSGTPGDFVEDSIFASSGSFNNDDYTVTDANFGDVDNDGDLDLFVSKTGSQGGRNDLILNDGTGRFQTVGATQLPGFSDKSGASIFDDFNGDGYVDVYVCNSHWTVEPQDSGDLMINLGAGAPGHFVDADATRFPDAFDDNLTIRNYAVSGDVDGDGDIDLIVLPHEFMGSQGSLVGSPALFVNQGGAQGGFVGSFVEESGFWAPGTSFVAGGALLADLDNDGDLDLLGTSIGGVIQANKVQDGLLLNQLF